MTIDWAAFTPWAALAGGALIGLAAAMFILLNGRIAGISGIVGGLLNPQAGDITWRIMFVLGMLCGLACAFCAYLFITRCRSQGPKMGRARTMYSDSEVAGARGAQGDVPASEL